MGARTASETIRDAVSGWPGVTVGRHRLGGLELLYGRRLLGHLHRDGLLDIPFPKAVRDELVATGRIEPRQRLSESGWVRLRLREPADLPSAVALLHRSYELAAADQRRRDAAPAARRAVADR